MPTQSVFKLSGEPMDMIEEFRLRCWARENYVTADDRQLDWHDVILDEMTRKDRELTDNDPAIEGWDIHSN